MKKLLVIMLITVMLLSVITMPVYADKPIKTDSEGNEIEWETSNNDCARIQDGTIYYSSGHYLAGQPLQVGFDPYGYNYQGHMFKGSYFNVYSGGAEYPPYEGDDTAYLGENPSAENHWAWPYRDVNLLMKWNDVWISNTDCDGDGLLDRHYGFPSYIGSGAWETNHQSGTYLGEDGTEHSWEYFVKIVAVPGDATNTDGVWYTVEGSEIGPDIWNQFAVIQRVYNDPYGGYHGIEYLSPTSAGFGYYAP